MTRSPPERLLLTESDFTNVRSGLIDSKVFFIAGTCTMYVSAINTKYLIKKACKLWPDQDGNLVYMPPGEAARAELDRAFPNIKRVGWSRGHAILFDKRPPIKHSGEAHGHMVYVDLVGAYHQIYRHLWLDAPYPRAVNGHYPLWAVARRLEEWKVARNSVIGVTRNRHVVAMRGTRRISLSVKNPYLSPFLWATVQGILHWIAGVAVTMGAIYVNTDGYVFLGSDSSDAFIRFLIDHRLSSTVRAAGEGHIRGWNCYKIGERETTSYEKSQQFTYTKEFDHVEGDRRWSNYWATVRGISDRR